jgi:hypothetical protein
MRDIKADVARMQARGNYGDGERLNAVLFAEVLTGRILVRWAAPARQRQDGRRRAS